LQFYKAERLSRVSDRWIWVQRLGLDLVFNESVHDLVHRIYDQGLQFIMRTIRSHPHVDNPTVGTSPSRTGILFLIHTVHQDLTAHALLPHSNPTTTETVQYTAAPLPPCPDPATRTPTFDPDGVTHKADSSRGDEIMLTSGQATKKSDHEKVRPGDES
jgi:hypothetical protein